MTATAVASCPCIPDEVFCAWSGCINKLNWTELIKSLIDSEQAQNQKQTEISF